MSTGGGPNVWYGPMPAPELEYSDFDYAIPTYAQGRWLHDSSGAQQSTVNTTTDPHRPWSREAEASAYQLLPAHPPPTHTSPSLRIISYMPSCGPPGCKFSVHFKSTQDLSVVSAFRYSVMFLDKRANASLKQVGQVGQDYRYVLSTHVPDLHRPSACGPCHVQVAVEDLASHNLEMLDVGKFTYKASKDKKPAQTSAKTSRKRRTAHNSEDPVTPQPKRLALSSQPPTMTPQSQWNVHPQPFQCSLAADWYASNNYTCNSLPPSMLYAQPLHGYGPVVQDTAVSQYLNSPETYHQTVSPRTLGGAEHIQESYGMDAATPAFGHTYSGTTSPSSENPPLIRTTQLPYQLGPTMTEQPDALSPYPALPLSHASLRLAGSLNSMQEKWTNEEKITRRRLVEFERSQAGSIITVTFNEVPLDSRSNTNICVSCIWWQERREAYITSVDTIRLLEHLVATRFNVQEKNRIRRNLEGFRPLTVAKGRSDSDEFFKVIMGFGEPKPRVIEKDIKVFPWKLLSHMLKKVIGKYSADYAATGSMLPPAAAARSSSSGPSSTSESWMAVKNPAQSPDLKHVTLGVANRHDWESSFSAFDTALIATQAGQQQSAPYLPPTNARYDSFYDVNAPRFQQAFLTTDACYMPTYWDSAAYMPSVALAATPGSASGALSSDFFLDELHHHFDDGQQTYQPDNLDDAKCF